MSKLFDLKEFRKLKDNYIFYQTHLYNMPYAICKAKKKTLENSKSDFIRYFTIVDNNS